MRYLSIFLVATIILAVVLGCNWSFGTNSNSTSNANNTNRSNSNRNDNDDYSSSSNSYSNSNSAKDMTHFSMDVSEMTSGSGDEDKVGRMVTVSDGVLENIDSDKLRIRGGYSGYAFYCYGSFTEYMSMADRVRSLNDQHRSPKVTVKGVYKVASTGTGGELNPCVLSDIEKP